MVKKLSLLSLLVCLMGLKALAQPCGFDIVHKNALRTNHDYAANVNDVNNRWVSSLKLGSLASLTYTSAGYVYEIPMVIHVLHTGGAVGTLYNPDSATLAGMVDYLNKAYAAVSPFPDTAHGGCRIPLRFVLAKRTPAGAATNGIIRVNASSITNYTANGANASLTTGVDPDVIMATSRFNPSDYYNVYVVNKIDGNDLTSTGGVAGFAYFPGYPTLDGMIVVASQARSGSTTIAHEFGHAYSLYHTFEGDVNGTTCPPNVNCTTDGDWVCDTEPHIRSASSPGWCPATDLNPCTGGSYKNVQHNIMDYTNCPPDRFTTGQRARVLSVIDDKRSGFKTSAGLLAPPASAIATACIPTATTGSVAMGPVTVSFNGMRVWTGSMAEEGGKTYVDHAYTQQSVVSKGSVYPIQVQTASNTQNVRVFIDYNNDGDFADAGELAYTHNGTTATETHSGNITISSSATTCTWLRMRVVSAWSGATITDYACGPLDYGQAEDYGIWVKNTTSADTVTIAQTAGTNPSCTGASVTFTATPKAGTPTYKWFVNGVATTVTTSTFTSTTLANNDVITCKTYYTTTCGPDSAVSNGILLKVNATAVGSAGLLLEEGSNPGCSGQRLVFRANLTGGGTTTTYQWKKGTTNVGTNSDTFSTSSLVSGDEIWCLITSPTACSSAPIRTDTITISFSSVTPDLTMVMTDGANPSCDSSSLSFTGFPKNGGTTPKYTWYVNGVERIGFTGDVYTDSFFLKNGDTVQLRMISTHPCVVPGSDTVWSDKVGIERTPNTVISLDVALTYGSNPGCLDSMMEFTATAVDGGGAPTISWYVNGTLYSYGTIFASNTLHDSDVITCKMEVTPGSCNNLDSLWSAPIRVRLYATPASPTISLIGNLLVASTATNIQWYGPSGLIPGATGATYHPTEIGNYYAVCVNVGCSSAPSNILNVALLSISPVNMSEVKIFPNPTTGYITLDWGKEKVDVQIDVFTVTGQRVVNTSLNNGTSKTLDLTTLGNGNYFIVIHDQNGKTGTVTITLSR